MTYEQWMEKVDNLFLTQFGLTHEDFEDFLWHDAWEDGDTPRQAFNRFCDEMGL